MTDAEMADLRMRAADRVLPRSATPAEALAALPELDLFVVWLSTGQQPTADAAS